MKRETKDESKLLLKLLNDAHRDYVRDREEYGWNRPPLEHAAEVLKDHQQLAKMLEGRVTRERLLRLIIDPNDPCDDLESP